MMGGLVGEWDGRCRKWLLAGDLVGRSDSGKDPERVDRKSVV